MPLQPVPAARLTLQPLSVTDAGFILQLLNEPSFHQYIGDRGVRTVDDALQYLTDGPLASYARHGHGLLRVSLTDGTPIGLCGLLRREGLEHPDLGFALLPAYWGQGLAFEASQAALSEARQSLGIGTVLAICSPDNWRSQRVLHKLGFVACETRPLATGEPPVLVLRLEAHAAAVRQPPP